MTLVLQRTDTALSEVRGFLKSDEVAKLDSSAVAAYLAGHLSIVLCGEIEQLISTFCDERIDGIDCDPQLSGLAKKSKRTPRSAKIKDIAAALEHFGADIRDDFISRVDDEVGEEGKARLGNVVQIRDRTAHETGPTITFSELEEAVAIAEKVLASARKALGLRTTSGGALRPGTVVTGSR